MFERLPERVNPFRLADVGRRLEGDIEVSRLERLRPALMSDEGQIRVRLEFDRNRDGRARIRGRLQGTLQLECQRCMEPMVHRIDDEFTVVVAESDAEAEMVQAEHEPLVIEDESIMLADLVEDELMLDLPLAPTHPESQDCMGRDLKEFDPDEVGEPVDEKDNPFAVLKTLKPN